MAVAFPEPQQYDQLAARGASMFRTFTATEDGTFLYAAEGGTIVVLEPFTAQGVPAPGKLALEDGRKRFQLGNTGAIPAAMMLDPFADPEPGSGAQDYLYVAAGRQGLWLAEADVSQSTPNKVWRVDDSGDLDPSTQESRRWCCDVDVVTVQGEQVLLALFAKRNASRLRAYSLDDVLALGSTVDETGNELVPLMDLSLGKHPLVNDAGVPELYGRGVAVAMDAVVLGSQGTETADVYVAMGHHGLAKVHLTGGYDAHSGEFGVAGSVAWGPVLGDGTSYHSASAEYGNLRFVIDDSAQEFSWWDTAPLLQRQERPLFADVAVDWREGAHHLYCAVDHLSWMRFDLDATWGTAMPIDLHEMDRDPATWPTGPGGQILGSAILDGTLLAGGGTAERTAFARKLQIQPIDGTSEVWLAVTFNDRPIVKDLAEARIEGVPYQHDLQYGGGGLFLATDRTLLYPLHDLGTTFPRYRAGLDHGGHVVQILAEQPLLGLTPPDNKLRLLHSYKLGSATPMGKKGLGVCLSQVHLHPPINQAGSTFGLADTYPRSISQSSGRMAFNIAPSPVDPRLLVAGTNDASLPIDGWLYTDTTGSTLNRHYTPPTNGTAGYLDFPSGHRFEIDGLWRETPTSDTFVSWNEGNIHTAVAGDLRWTYSRVQIPNADAVANAPQVLQRWRFDAPLDQFLNNGREYYYWGYRSTYFEQQTGALSLLFANRSRSAQGMVMIDAEHLEDWLANDGADNHDLGTDPGLTSSKSTEWNNVINVDFGHLTTHPEFNGMPLSGGTQFEVQAWWLDESTATDPFTQQVHSNPGLDDPVNNVLTWPPEVIPVRASASSTTLDGWVLAVPCAFLTADPDWDVFDNTIQGGSSAYLPATGSPMRDHFSHALWQFWPVEVDTSQPVHRMAVRRVPGGNLAGNSSLPKYIYDPPGNDPVPGHAWEVEWLTTAEDPQVVGDEHAYAFLLDFVGRLHVLDVADVLQQEHLVAGQPAYTEALLTELETWETPQGLFDTYGNNCFDIALELEHGTPLAPGAKTRIFLAVRRVGVVVLEFDPTTTPMLTEVETIQTGEYTHGVEIQRIPGQEPRLLVSDYGGGVRVFDI